jgi:tetratricopeptide (TPR) repeat protein
MAIRWRPAPVEVPGKCRKSFDKAVCGRAVARMVGMRGRLLLLLWTGLGIGLPGCRLPGWDGPISRSLAASRQLSQQGQAAMEGNRWREAESLLAQSVKTCPDDPDARRHYGEALWHRGAKTEAVAQLLEASQHAPEDAELRVRIAEMQLELGHVDMASRTAQLALDLDPKLASAWAVRGRVKRAREQLRPALADLHHALSLDPGNRAVQLEVAELYRQLNEPQRALVTLQNLMDSYPPGQEPQEVYRLEGLAYMALGRFNEAVESFTAANLRGGPNPEILCRLGEAELLAGRPSQAAAAAREALALDPGHQPSQELLGRVDVAFRNEGPGIH